MARFSSLSRSAPVRKVRDAARLVVLLAELAAAGWLGAGCACTSAEAEAPPAVETAAELARLRGPGGTPAQPIERCGPRESYDWLANRFRCPEDGDNPFDGDWRQAASHRLGKAAVDHRGHIVDVYEVPCDRARVGVYVDMYSCAPPARR